METFIPHEYYEQAAQTIRQCTRQQPTVGLVLGSGLGEVADEVEQPDIIPYAEIRHWPRSTVEGHSGRLVIGRLAGPCVAIMQGRAHYYEGYSLSEITLPVRVMKLLGIDTLIVTNAAGGLNPTFQPGDIMLITDHLNLVGMGGQSPLRGPNDEFFGPRFPDMSAAYDPELCAIALSVAEKASIPVQQGVYAGLAGPAFETPAEIRLLRLFGADAVGMSTVAETIVARHTRMRVLGLSGISNVALTEPGQRETSHQEVLAAGQQISPRLSTIIRRVLQTLDAA